LFSPQFEMSAQSDWNHLVVDLRNNIFKLVFFAFDCSKSAADDVLPSASGNVETSRSGSSSGGSSSSSDSSVRRRQKKKKKKPLRKQVKRVPPPPPPSKSRRLSPSVKRKKSAASSPPPAEDVGAVRRLVEDANFQNMLY
jgi:hypothetical protein